VAVKFVYVAQDIKCLQ